MGCGASGTAVSAFDQNTLHWKKAHGCRLTTREKKVFEVLKGNFKTDYSSDMKIIRIFTSSTFTDTKHERDALMEKAYPKLKTYCQSRGYEFQVVDMRWGIRDEAADDHMTTELCLREIEACQKLSTGPNFVTLLSHKYGQRPLLRTIDVNEFNTIVDGIAEEETKKLVLKWYLKDENYKPSMYVLQPISVAIPNFTSPDEELRKMAKAEWKETQSRLQVALTDSAKVKLRDEEAVYKYIRSVTASEIEKGLFEVSDPGRSCLWFHRILKPIDSAPPDFIDVKQSSDEDVSNLLDTLKKERIPSALPLENITSYTVRCSNTNGFDPSMLENSQYLDRLCTDFQNKLQQKVEDAIKERAMTDVNDDVFGEVLQHAKFCEEKCEMFHGQTEALHKIQSYIQGSESTPFVIHGESGCGKTSLVAMAAHSTRDWLSNDTVVVLRFIGTTPFSTTLRPLLYSISSQITQVYGDETPVSEDLRDLTKDLKQRLENATPQMPLVLFLDSLDQFDSDDGAHQLLWLPTTLPDNVRLVVSTLVDDKYECYPTLKANLWNDDIFLEVPKMKNDDVKVILTKWLSSRNRTLTEAQTNVLIGAFQKCPLPLFLKISFDVACQWASYTNPQQTIIYQAIYREATNESDSPVRRVISALFETVERSHGEMLVSRALSYITAGRSGLTENELEDVLSCDDDVLNDVFQYWTPPIRRLPPLLWIRVRADLAPYFVERGADGARVLYWYHRQFTEAARDRYLRDHHPKSLIHANLSDYFMGAWANGNKKPYKTRDGTTGEKDRLVAAQPLVFDEHTYNIRKMNELPFHLIRSNQQDKLETQVLCNFTWLLTKMTATSVRRVIDDFKFARSIYPGNEKINTVAELLQLAHHALEKNPDQLASQIVGRISSFDGLEDLLNNARNPHKPCLLPTTAFLTRPGGMLVHSLAGHTHRIYALDIAESGKYALTGSFDATVKLWDIEEGVLLKNMENVGETIQTIRFCKHDDMFVLSALDFGQSYVKVFKTETMTLLKSFETTSGYPTAFAIAKGGSHLIIPEQCELEVIDLNTLTISQKIVDEFLNAMGASATVEARGDIVAYFLTQDFDRKHVRVADLSKPDLPKTTVEVIFEEKYDKRYSATIGGIALIPNKLVVCNQTRSIFHIYSNYGETLTKVIVDLDGITGAHGAAASFCTTFDGRYILVTRFDKVVVWDLEKETKAVMLEHPYFIYRIASRDMSRVVSTSPDKLVRVWDITRGKMAVHVTHQEPRCMGEAPEEIRQLLCPAGYDQLVTMSVGSMVNGRSIVTLWDLGTSRPLSKLKAVSSKPVFWKMLNASTAIASVDKTLKLVNVLKGCIILTFQGKIPNHTTWLAVIEDNRKLMTLSEDQTLVNIYDMSDGTICDVLTHANSAVISDFRVNDNGDGNILVTQLRSQYDCVHIWDLETRQIRHSIRIDNKLGKVALDNSAISSDGMYLSLITYGKSRKKGLLVWNLKTGKQVYHHRKDDTSVLDIVAVENGKLVVQYSDKSICLLNLSTGSLVTELRGHYEFISQFEVTKDNRRIMAFSDRERKLAVWSCDDGTCLGSFTLEKKSKVQLACEGQIIVVLDVYGLTPPILLRVHGQGYTPFPLPDENTDADNEEVDVTMTLQEKVTVLKLWEECAE